MKLLRNNRTKTDCGIVAAYNAAAWAGIPATYAKVRKTANSCGYRSDKGIYFFQFSNLLKKLGIPAKRFRPKSATQMGRKIRSGKLLIIFYIPTGYDVGHVLSSLVNHEGVIKVINPEPRARRTWRNFIEDIHENGMKEFRVYEIPNRQPARRVAKRNDDRRSA